MAQYEDITIDQGADVALEIHLMEVDGSTKDLSDHTVTAQLKKTYNSDSDHTYDFNCMIPAPATDGIVILSLDNTLTDSLKSRRYVYDAEISHFDSDGNQIVERFLEGQINVNLSVTRIR